MPPMGPNFQDVNFVSPTSVDVTGTFDTHATVFGDVIVRILVIPFNDSDPTKTAAALQNPMVGQTVVGPSNPGFPLTTTPPLTTGSFAGTASVAPGHYTVAPGDKVRLIGITVAVKAPDVATPPTPQDPPAFETFTWCVTRTIQ